MCESSISDPMSFLYLDMLSTILINDTKEFEKLFDTKVNFIREQEHNCQENAKQLAFVDQFVDTLKNCVFQTELELQENEFELLEAEKIISHYESSYVDASTSLTFTNIQFKYSNYLVLLKLLLSADRSAAQCNKLKDDIEQYNIEAYKYLEPIKLITKIMDYHKNTLDMMENQINKLECMTKEVASNYDELNKRLKISSLTTKCTCEMANVINDIYQN
ncbi:uncharacterized protein LOC117790845 [Drosophila innubila]|uniref:uncharacterized protein LOC117790845 n=1 Tax=Drosophila innubila TaxID=198719 RepID=UPI00148C9348|nr:uncharacterized protein LOC117790845 [Drosophila innubila]